MAGRMPIGKRPVGSPSRDDPPSPGVGQPATKRAQKVDLSPTSNLQPLPPGIDSKPKLDCSLDDFEAWIIAKLGDMAEHTRDLEEKLHEKFQALGKTDSDLTDAVRALEPLVPHTRDLSVFSGIKTFVTEERLQGMHADLEGQTKKMHDLLEDAKRDVDKHAKQVETVEGMFKEHVEGKFQVVEAECLNLRAILESVAMNNAGQNEQIGQLNATAGAAFQLQVNMFKETTWLRELPQKHVWQHRKI